MKKKYIDSSLPIEQVLLRLAKDEYPDRRIEIEDGEIWMFTTDNDTSWPPILDGQRTVAMLFELTDFYIGPIWRREADNLANFFYEREMKTFQNPDYAMDEARFCSWKVSKSLESIARHVCNMKHPEGIEV